MRFKIVQWLTILIISASVVTPSPDLNSFTQTHLQRQEGEKQYQLLKSNANLPEYGACWTQAVDSLENTCAHLTETTQAALAWRFTKCFMDQSLDVKMEICEPDNKECLEGVPERIFQAYTHFYTHTQNICFYLMSQVWHTETEHTISALRTHSLSVSKQLEMAGRLQVNLLQQQREGLKVQRQLVEHGMNLSEVLHESRGRLARLTAEFRNSTIEHGRQLGDLFKRISMLHNWFVGEYAFVEQIMYFSAQLTLIFILTTSKRTEGSRLLLFLLSAVQILVECLLLRIQQSDILDDANVKQFANIWLCRKMFIALIALIYVTMASLYVDHHQLTVNLLRIIENQNNEMLLILRAAALERPSRGLDRLNGLNGRTAAESVTERVTESAAESAVPDEDIHIQNVNNWDKMIQMDSENILATTGDTLEGIRNFERNLTRELSGLSVSKRLRPRRATPGYM